MSGGRRYREKSDSPQVGPEVVERVRLALEREADLDGIVTATSERLGELAGVSRTSARFAIDRLIKEGHAAQVGRVGGHGVKAIRISESPC